MQRSCFFSSARLSSQSTVLWIPSQCYPLRWKASAKRGKGHTSRRIVSLHQNFQGYIRAHREPLILPSLSLSASRAAALPLRGIKRMKFTRGCRPHSAESGYHPVTAASIIILSPLRNPTQGQERLTITASMTGGTTPAPDPREMFIFFLLEAQVITTLSD